MEDKMEKIAKNMKKVEKMRKIGVFIGNNTCLELSNIEILQGFQDFTQNQYDIENYYSRVERFKKGCKSCKSCNFKFEII